MGPFEERPLHKKGFFHRLFRMADSENAYISVENLLAKRNWNDLDEGQISNILRDHGLKQFDHSKAVKIYEKAFVHFLADRALSDDEVRHLFRLQQLLGIGNDDLEQIERRIIHPIYGQAIQDVLADNRINEEGRRSLEAFRLALRLDEQKALDIYQSHVTEIIQRQWANIASDRRISDEELACLQDQARNLGTKLNMDPQASAQLDRFRSFWRMENGIFPQVVTSINLHRNEKCHLSVTGIWKEKRTVTTAVRYAGPAINLRIIKGLYYRAGQYQLQRLTSEEMRQISSGVFYITDKRIIFHGQPKSTAIRLSNVISFIPYSDAIEIEKTSGRNPFFLIDDVEYASVLLSALLVRI
jgi:hypothetical protein